MLDMSQPISLTFVFSTVGAIFAVIGVCVYLVNQMQRHGIRGAWRIRFCKLPVKGSKTLAQNKP